MPRAATKPDDLAEVRRIVLAGLRGLPARVFLFGSRSRGTARSSSDIDVAVLPLVALPAGTLASIREALEESRVPLAVDLVDISEADAPFRDRVLREGVSWND